MRKIFLLPFCFLFIFCSNQMKLNKGKEIDIFLKEGIYNLNTENKIKYNIINNTNNFYIIDPNGFYGSSYTLENGEKMIPIRYFSKGYYNRFNDNDCKKDLIILKPKESKNVALSLNGDDNSLYNYTKGKVYAYHVSSLHNKYNATIFGCNQYIDNLEKKGYKVLQDSIVAKIPIVP
ncbi:hypothetical protein [Chryseobacterium jejuense]|uniref:hypothetical protein n=1 Tax=Chryseobacterium jejuense TaxID=445960 RepID=UPI001AE4EEF7|nr:hypothetical protein [Chryseobacterium jejuense]MBP2617103.1 asparagine N-glycosylation enzyme membrane subunit Stt3 [Chryseobacterium jejuense]